MERIVVGDRVLAYHDVHQSLVFAEVTHVAAHGPTAVVRLHTSMGELCATSRHRVLAGGQWMPVHSLEIGQEVAAVEQGRSAFARVVVESVEPEPERRRVYNLYVEDACTFVSNNLVANSYVVLPNLRTKWNRLGVRVRHLFHRRDVAHGGAG